MNGTLTRCVVELPLCYVNSRSPRRSRAW